jgi:exosome complex component CSL4
MQAMLSITVVDGVPLPPGEEFTGLVRVQDVRATDKDRVKIGDCFRGGDVVRGLVVSTLSFCNCYISLIASIGRFHSVMPKVISLQPLAMILA